MSKKQPRNFQILAGDDLIRARELKRREGRYSVKEAIEILEDQTGERFPVAKAAWVGDLRYFMQGSLQEVPTEGNKPEEWKDWPVFNEHTEVYWDDLNKWLADNSKITYRFPEPSAAPETPAMPVNAVDFSLLATRTEIMSAFGVWGLKREWFNTLKDRQWLLAARIFKGQGKKGNVAEPLFCPFAVMNGVINKIKREQPMSAEAGWRILELKFPNVYAANEIADPRERTG